VVSSPTGSVYHVNLGVTMKETINQIGYIIDVAVWIAVLVIYATYSNMLLIVELILSYLTKWIYWTKTLNKGGKKLV